MNLRIKEYEIRTYDRRNLEVVKHVTKTIISQIIADKMNEKASEERYKVGDEYAGEDFIGFYPNLTQACIAILNEMSTELNEEDATSICDAISKAKEEIIEAVHSL